MEPDPEWHETKLLAAVIGGVDFLEHELSLNIGPRQRVEFAESLQPTDRMLKSSGVNAVTYTTRKVRAERICGGVLVGISACVEERRRPRVEEEGERSLTMPDGLSIAHITGIDPLGEYEWEIMERLQQGEPLVHGSDG